jgi:cell division protein FtsL
VTKVNVFVAVLVWISAFVLVSTQYRVRQLTIEINRARDLAYQLDNDRTKGSLAQSRLSTPSRVETTAKDLIGMELPDPMKTKIVDMRATSATAGVRSGASTQVAAGSSSTVLVTEAKQ